MLSGARLLLANSIQIGHVIRIENAGEGTDKKMGCWKEVQRTIYAASKTLACWVLCICNFILFVK
jgi:hypothetical protein